ncbi:ribonuclease P/MRP protein subunit [Kalaharituber pfeilii]|nr:ribonuclease P/MRP protein subunit [Kalaharituber pfeilii]
MVRYKSRYLLFNILYPNAPSTNSINPSIPTHLDFCAPTDPAVTPQVLASVVRDAITLQFGDWGSGMTSSLSGNHLPLNLLKYFSPQTSTGIIRVSRDHHRLVWCALTLIKEILGKPVVIRVVRVSGTIKKAELEGIKRAKEEIRRVRELEMQMVEG